MQTKFQSRAMHREARNFLASPDAPIYERRDTDPNVPHLKRRYGSTRRTDIAAQNAVGVTAEPIEGGPQGAVWVDRNFDNVGDIGHTTAGSAGWTIYGSLRVPANQSGDHVCDVLSFDGVRLRLNTDTSETGTAQCKLYVIQETDNATVGNVLSISADDLVDIDFCLWRDGTAINLTNNSSDAANDLGTATPAFDAHTVSKHLVFFPILPADANYVPLKDVVINNICLYDGVANETLANGAPWADITPATTLSGETLVFHNTFTDGGPVLTNAVTTTTDYVYSAPNMPQVVSGDSTYIHFGGRGVADLPFYSDFDDFYASSLTSVARTNWMFQVKLKTPKTTATPNSTKAVELGVVFEFEKLCKLEVIDDSGTQKFKATFGGNASLTQTVSTGLAADTTYNIKVGVDAEKTSLTVDATTAVSSSADYLVPSHDYQSSLSFLIGDSVTPETQQPFTGLISLFALDTTFNTSNDIESNTALIYYTHASVQADELIDVGNRGNNAFLGIRERSKSPFYTEGSLSIGSFKCATGGFLLSDALPAPGYTGNVKATFKDDASVQRMGDSAFITSNGHTYYLNTRDKNFRPLGLPRPTTKVSQTALGTGVLDGVYGYSYRWISKQGTTGPAIDLDPVHAKDGVKLFLGAAEGGGIPEVSEFGQSYLKLDASNEWLACIDLSDQGTPENIFNNMSDGNSGAAMGGSTTGETPFTFETCVKFPTLAGVEETVFEQGVTGKGTGIAKMFAYENKDFNHWGRDDDFTFQMAFRWNSNQVNQTLFAVARPDQKYHTGWGPWKDNYWRTPYLLVSIQQNYANVHPGGQDNDCSTCITITRMDNGGTRQGHVTRSVPYQFVNGNDYQITLVREDVSNDGASDDLSLYVLNQTTKAASSDPNAGYIWQTNQETSPASDPFSNINIPTGVALTTGNTGITIADYFKGYQRSSPTPRRIFWGGARSQGQVTSIKCQITSGSSSNNNTYTFSYQSPFCVSGTAGEGRLYHARIWKRALNAVEVQRTTKRYLSSGMARDIYTDVSFAPKAGYEEQDKGWCREMDIPAYFYNKNAEKVDPKTTINESVALPIFQVGADVDTSGTYDAISNSALWAKYSSLHQGSLAIGCGSTTLFQLGTKAWLPGDRLRLFTDFTPEVKLTEFTWLTAFCTLVNVGTAATPSVILMLERIFIDGETGDWGAISGTASSTTKFAPDATTDIWLTLGPAHALTQTATYSQYHAETRVFPSEHYFASGGGEGLNAFEFLSSRVPPDKYENMWKYFKFMAADDNGDGTLDHYGTYPVQSGGNADARFTAASSGKFYRGTSAVTDGSLISDVLSDSGGDATYTPFPSPPQNGIRGIQIFRTNTIPVNDTLPDGSPNPTALSEAMSVAKNAPRFFLTEISTSDTSYLDNAEDAFLGDLLDTDLASAPPNAGVCFEWQSHLGICPTDSSTVYFSDPGNEGWETFPRGMIYDIPLKEDGAVTAGGELGARDARSSRALLCGKSWAVFLDGSPTQPICNTLGGGVGASSSKCFAIQNSIAYAYNGTLWAVSGDGAVVELSRPVKDLLPEPANARISISGGLASLFLIDDSTGLALRYHFPNKSWTVEDRDATSVTDIDGTDNWVTRGGYVCQGNKAVYGDDITAGLDSFYACKITGTNVDWANKKIVFSTAEKRGALSALIGSKVLIVDNASPSKRVTGRIASFTDSGVNDYYTITADDDTAWATFYAHGSAAGSDFDPYLVPGVGYWGTMVDTGQFSIPGRVEKVHTGIIDGSFWVTSAVHADYAKKPDDRTAEVPVKVGTSSTTFGVNSDQRVDRLLVYHLTNEEAEVSELELELTPYRGD